MNTNQKIFACVSLVIASVVTVATSKKEDTEYQYYGAASNCANATTTNQAISTSFGSIVTPAGMTFLDLGIPKSTLDIAVQTTVSGTITGGLTRVCTYSLSTASGTLHVYSCSDNGNPVCQVTFTPQ
ncbi:hypothetical protein CIK05_14530 [Bdellovibrio sp. qaytius]|nr:hypothetical protein CIK05_14530 [Bdellovibrio sp. qaytius]